MAYIYSILNERHQTITNNNIRIISKRTQQNKTPPPPVSKQYKTNNQPISKALMLLRALIAMNLTERSGSIDLYNLTSGRCAC